MASPLVADSFRVRLRDGRAEIRGCPLHVDRFTRSVRQIASPEPLTTGSLDAFLRRAFGEITAFGDGFPRLEYHGDGRFEVRLRALPELNAEIELRSFSMTSPPHPTRKGPNIERYAAVNRDLRAEGLRTDEDGLIVEGSTTSIVWWSEDALHVSGNPARVPSVTEALVCDDARRRGVPVRASAIEAETLAEHEVWAVNALHGIRLVLAIDGREPPAEDVARLLEFRTALDERWLPFAA